MMSSHNYNQNRAIIITVSISTLQNGTHPIRFLPVHISLFGHQSFYFLNISSLTCIPQSPILQEYKRNRIYTEILHDIHECRGVTEAEGSLPRCYFGTWNVNLCNLCSLHIPLYSLPYVIYLCILHMEE